MVAGGSVVGQGVAVALAVGALVGEPVGVVVGSLTVGVGSAVLVAVLVGVGVMVAVCAGARWNAPTTQGELGVVGVAVGEQGSAVGVIVAASVAVGSPGEVLVGVAVGVPVAVLVGSFGPGSAGVDVGVAVDEAVGVNSGARIEPAWIQCVAVGVIVGGQGSMVPVADDVAVGVGVLVGIV